MGLAATVVTLLLLGATGPETLDATPKPTTTTKPTTTKPTTTKPTTTIPAPTGIKLYPYGPKRPTQVGGVFKTCQVIRIGKAVDIHSTSTDDKWDLQIYLNPWRGGNESYILYYGTKNQDAKVRVSGVGGPTFSTAFPPPPGIYVHPAGKLAFSSGGSVVTLATTTYDGPYTGEVYLEGAIVCPALGS
jgi:hypothetical protein